MLLLCKEGGFLLFSANKQCLGINSLQCIRNTVYHRKDVSNDKNGMNFVEQGAAAMLFA